MTVMAFAMFFADSKWFLFQNRITHSGVTKWSRGGGDPEEAQQSKWHRTASPKYFMTNDHKSMKNFLTFEE